MLALCLAFVFAIGVHAQKATVTSGGIASGSGGTLNYSVGQLTSNVSTGTTGSVASGVQQAYQIMIQTGIEATAIGLSVLAYPNPTSDFLSLKIENQNVENLNFQLFDMEQWY